MVILIFFSSIQGLNWWETSEDLNTLYLGLGGLAYAAEYRQDAVRKLRNPFLNLSAFMRLNKKRRRDLGLKLRL